MIFQGFGWHSCDVGGWYKIIKDNVKEIKKGGFTHVWFPPPSESVAPQGYLPGELYGLNTPYGTEAELRECLQALADEELLPVADIVINHRTAGR